MRSLTFPKTENGLIYNAVTAAISSRQAELNTYAASTKSFITNLDSSHGFRNKLQENVDNFCQQNKN